MDNGAFLAAVQWISSFDAVTGTEVDAADADGSFLHFRDVHHREADKVTVLCLKDKLDRMEETLKAVSKTLQEVKTELETVKGRQEVAEIKLDTVAAKLDTARDID